MAAGAAAVAWAAVVVAWAGAAVKTWAAEKVAVAVGAVLAEAAEAAGDVAAGDVAGIWLRVRRLDLWDLS